MNQTKLKPSRVYETFWQFAAERQRIFFAKLFDLTSSVTADPILHNYRFTNTYRAADRVSQYLIRHVLYSGSRLGRDVFLRSLLFRLFNQISTWNLLQNEFGEITYENFSAARYGDVLDRAKRSGLRIYSSAYIMPSGKSTFGHDLKHRNHLALLELMLRSGLPGKVENASSFRQVYELLRGYPSIGPFLAFQLAIDLNYSELVDYSEMEFVVPGPGARSGIRKCFADLGGLSESDVIKEVAERQAEEFERYGLEFRTLWGRPLQLVDVQNLFCEVDKYTRISHPNVAGLGNRTRIKRRYKPSTKPIAYWFPPKWGINERIDSQIGRPAT